MSNTVSSTKSHNLRWITMFFREITRFTSFPWNHIPIFYEITQFALFHNVCMKSRLFFVKSLLFFVKSQDFLPLSLRIFLYEWKSWLCCPNKMLICNQNGDRSPKVSFFLQSISWTWLTKSQYHNPAKRKMKNKIIFFVKL